MGASPAFYSLPALAFTVVFVFNIAASNGAEEQPCASPDVMNNARLEILIKKVGDNVEGRPGFWQFTVANRGVIVITDENADRMRILSGIIETGDVDNAQLTRMMQANFDSALDARYAVAKGVLWSVYVHPLANLDDDGFISGLAQVVNLAATYGGSYSSGALTFRGGDSGELMEELRERANAI